MIYSVIIHLCIYSISKIAIECLHQHARGHPIYDNSYKSKNNFVRSVEFALIYRDNFQVVYIQSWPVLCLFAWFCLFLSWNWWHKLICKESVFLSKQSTVYIQLNLERRRRGYRSSYIIIHKWVLTLIFI